MPRVIETSPPRDEPRDSAVLTSLERAVAEVDPTEVVSLLDALESPGEAAYSPEARNVSPGFPPSWHGSGGTATSRCST